MRRARNHVDCGRKRRSIWRSLGVSLVCLGLFSPEQVLAQEEQSLAEELGQWRAVSRNLAALSYDAIIAPERADPMALIQLAGLDGSQAEASEVLMLTYALSSVLDNQAHELNSSQIANKRVEGDQLQSIQRTLRGLARPMTSERERLLHLQILPQKPQHLATQRIFRSLMLALAHTNNTQNIAHVLSYALNYDPASGWEQKAAHDALMSQAALADRLAPLVILAPDLQRQLTQTIQLKQELPSIQTLIRAAKETPGELREEMQELMQLLTRPRDKGANHRVLVERKKSFFAQAAWDKAIASDPLWTLRVATLLHQSLPKGLARSMTTLAQLQRDERGDLGASARWYLRTTATTRAQEPLLTWAQETKQNDKTVAQQRGPLGKSSLSTRQLWTVYSKNHTPDAVAALCSRYSPELATRETTVQSANNTPSTVQMRLWLNDSDSSTRAACLWGLGMTKPASLLPLLIQLYFVESDPAARAPITTTLLAYLGREHALIRRIAILDADLRCREIARAGGSVTQVGFFVGHAFSQMNIITRQGRTYVLSPASDGFIAAIDPDL